MSRSSEPVSSALARLNTKVVDAAKRGENKVKDDMDGVDYDVVVSVVSFLKEDGYTVTKEPYTLAYLEVAW